MRTDKRRRLAELEKQIEPPECEDTAIATPAEVMQWAIGHIRDRGVWHDGKQWAALPGYYAHDAMEALAQELNSQAGAVFLPIYQAEIDAALGYIAAGRVQFACCQNTHPEHVCKSARTGKRLLDPVMVWGENTAIYTGIGRAIEAMTTAAELWHYQTGEDFPESPAEYAAWLEHVREFAQ